ncbi:MULTISPECIES: hypothetical protein [Mameliella]|uniref:hypothetical protein n=1 Tax=Mameliella TaxID=1434019 RepID=UPI0010564D91|nr:MULTISPECIES: hypothetical protein [Mameliella]MCR9272538.1 hypothetical protein [Paracoccaceae bacterium]
MARLVLIHGRAQEGKSEAALIEEWMTPLRRALGDKASCLDKVEVRAPFYGDRLVEFLSSLGEPTPGDILVRGSNIYEDDEKYRAFLGEHFEALRQRKGIEDAALLEEANIDLIERGPQNWLWVLAVIRFLNKIPGIDAEVIESLLRDVWIYFQRQTVRKEIDKIVASAFKTELPVVCIAHSLGTIVGYNILKNFTKGSVPQFMTLGSPLGLDISRRALSPLVHPPTVGRWFNARDRRDVVALYPLSGDRFPVVPVISNYDDVENQTSNSHGISGYIGSPVVAKELYSTLSNLEGVHGRRF